MPFVRVGDIEVCYDIEGSGPRLLKIWGTGGDLRRQPTEFDRRLPERFTVLAFDQRGMGRSGKNKRKPQEGRLQSPVDFIGWGLGDGSRPCIGMDGREA